MKSLGWALIHDDWCSYKMRHFAKETRIQREDDVSRNASIASKPPEARREAQTDSPTQPQKDSALPTPPSQTLSLQH